MFKKPDYSELPKGKNIYFLASGGRDSTAMILEAWRLGIKGTMILGDTGFNKPSAIQTLKRIEKETGFPLVRIKANIDKKPIVILKESFYKIPKALELYNAGQTYKKVFPCCAILKKKPMVEWLRSQDPDNSVFVLGIKGGDGALHRRYRMRELRDRNTYLRRHKENDLLYIYPLRDLANNDISAILREFNYSNISSSGCSICPIFCVANWSKKDPHSSLRSIRYARKLGIDFPEAAQTELRDFCAGVK